MTSPLAMAPTVVSLAGPPGVSKSSVMARLRARLTAVFVEEDVVDWEPFLADFYKTRTSASCLSLQMRTLKHFVSTDKRLADAKDLVVVERSLVEAERVFLQMAIDSGVLAPHSTNQYRSYRRDLMDLDRGVPPGPDHVILLKAPPATCFDRQRARARPSELGYTDLPGMEAVCSYYETFEASLRRDGRPAHLVDASGTLDDTVNGVMQVLSDLGTLSPGHAWW